MFSIRHWRPIHLIATWAGYWAALAAVTLGPAIAKAYRVVNAPGSRGSINLGMDGSNIKLTIVDNAVTVFSGLADITTIAALIAGPPLLLWVIWLVTRPRRQVVPPAPPPALGEGPWTGAPDAAQRQREDISKER